MPVNPAACQGTAMPPGMLLQAVLFLFLLVVVSVWDIKNRIFPNRERISRLRSAKAYFSVSRLPNNCAMKDALVSSSGVRSSKAK